MTAALATPSYPALAAATPQLVENEDMAAANGLATGIENATWVAGPGLLGLVLLAGAPIADGGVAAAVCFGVALLSLGRTTTGHVKPTTEAGSGFLSGIREVRVSPRMRVLVTLAAINNALYGYATVAIVLIGATLLGQGPQGIGALNAAFAVGAFLSMALAARLRPNHGIRRVLLFTAGFAVAGVTLAMSRSLAVALLAVLFAGLFTVIAEVAAVTGIQRIVADETAARVFGFYDTVAVGAIAVATVSAGWVSDQVGVRTGLLAACAAAAMASVLTVVLARRHGESLALGAV